MNDEHCNAETAVAKQLVDKIYEKRKAAALDLEKYLRVYQKIETYRRVLIGKSANVIFKEMSVELGKSSTNWQKCSAMLQILFILGMEGSLAWLGLR
jgi:hypothetical protein